MSLLSQTCVFISYIMQEKPEMPDNYYINQKGGKNMGLQSYLLISVRQGDYTSTSSIH